AVFLGKLRQVRRRVFLRASRRSVSFAVGPMARCTVGMKHFIARIWRGRLYRFLLDFFGLGLRFARNDRKGKNGPPQASSAENICHHAWPPSIGTERLVESRVVIGQRQRFLNETLLMQGLRFSRHPCQ